MNTYAGPELAEAFRTVRKNTVQIAGDIPEEQYGFRATPETRSVAQMLVHIAYAPRFAYRIHGELKLTSFENFDFMGLMQDAQAAEKDPPSKAAILEELQRHGEMLANWMQNLTPEFLAEMVTPPAIAQQPPKSRFEMLLGVKEHEMHHRGQLMLIERMVGVVPHLTREREARMAAMMARTAAKS